MIEVLSTARAHPATNPYATFPFDPSFLVKLLPPATVLAIILIFLFIKYWEKIEKISRALLKLISRIKTKLYVFLILNPKLKRAFKKAHEEEPLLEVYDDYIPTVIRHDPSVSKPIIHLEKDKAVVKLPTVTIENIVKATSIHINEYLSCCSVVKGFPKLQRALDLVVLTLVVQKMNMNGALKIALRRFLQDALKDETVECTYKTLMAINGKMRETDIRLERRFLMIMLTEIFGGKN